MFNMFNNVRMVQTEPGIIIGPLASLLGFILDFMYNVIAFLAGYSALGWTIILFTIIIHFAILPMGIKMQKNMKKMQSLKPMQDVINEKYKDKKDKESQQQKALEMQKLFSDNNVKPLAGCLPMLLQMPIMMTLFFMFQRSYLYISQLNQVYARIAEQVMLVPNFYVYIQNTPSIGLDKIPQNMVISLGQQTDLMRLFNVYTSYDWQTLLSVLPSQYLNYQYIQQLIYQKEAMEHFLGISMSQNPGFGWPGILLIILSGITSFISSHIMMKNQPTPSVGAEGAASMMASQQKMMTYFVPIMMTFMTVISPGALGLYWIVSSIFRTGQQIGLNKWIEKKESKESNIIDVK